MLVNGVVSEGIQWSNGLLIPFLSVDILGFLENLCVGLMVPHVQK